MGGINEQTKPPNQTKPKPNQNTTKTNKTPKPNQTKPKTPNPPRHQ